MITDSVKVKKIIKYTNGRHDKAEGVYRGKKFTAKMAYAKSRVTWKVTGDFTKSEKMKICRALWNKEMDFNIVEYK